MSHTSAEGESRCLRHTGSDLAEGGLRAKPCLAVCIPPLQPWLSVSAARKWGLLTTSLSLSLGLGKQYDPDFSGYNMKNDRIKENKLAKPELPLK